MLEKQVFQADSKRLEKVLEGLSALCEQIKNLRLQQKNQQESHKAELNTLREAHASETETLKKGYEKKLEENEEILLMAQMEQEELQAKHQAAFSELRQAHSDEMSALKTEYAQNIAEKEQTIAHLKSEHQTGIDLIKKDYDAVLSVAEALLEEVNPVKDTVVQEAEIVKLPVGNDNVHLDKVRDVH
ncbi:hypothetical protein FAI41_02185 [Acetobacteraceae bacterium]|nr:hypothetical protein FAI41_02185 [Acetobacteraceae bacterium]